MDWQKIETAPKDGTAILAFMADAVSPSMAVAEFVDDGLDYFPGETGAWFEVLVAGWVACAVWAYVVFRADLRSDPKHGPWTLGDRIAGILFACFGPFAVIATVPETWRMLWGRYGWTKEDMNKPASW